MKGGDNMANKQELIASDLAQKIRHHFYRVGELLPSENQLVELYGASRETIRSALAILMDLGMIQKIRGKGSVVLDFEKFTFPISGITSFKELNQRLGLQARTEILACHPTHEIAPYFVQRGVDAKMEAMYIERLRFIEEVPSVLDCDYLLSPPIPLFDDVSKAQSLYDYVEKELGLEVSYATKEITVESPNDEIAEKLALTTDDKVVVIRSLSYLCDTTLFQLTESYHRPDKFKFNDFARRNKIDL